MKERPILFSGPMVQAILAGRKTQTRRAVKVPELNHSDFAKGNGGAYLDGNGFLSACTNQRPGVFFYAGDKKGRKIRCPYGVPGDRLWVREKWYVNPCGECVGYAADGEPVGHIYKPKPSIHLPRKFARITLELTDVRVQRVQEITEVDAVAEGMRCGTEGQCVMRSDGSAYRMTGHDWSCDDKWDVAHNAPTHAFHSLWDTINAKRGYPWADNPWVWALSFKVLKP